MNNALAPATPTVFSDWPNEDRGQHIKIFQDSPRILSVFDAVHYDRADADIVSPAMRMHVVKKLASIGFKQTSGSTLEHKASDTRCIIPKLRALGASPFYVLHSNAIRQQDFYVLTPTQAACLFIAYHSVELAVQKITELIQTQAINVMRLSDYLEYAEEYQSFTPAIGHLRYLQREAIESGAYKKIRPLTLRKH